MCLGTACSPLDNVTCISFFLEPRIEVGTDLRKLKKIALRANIVKLQSEVLNLELNLLWQETRHRIS